MPTGKTSRRDSQPSLVEQLRAHTLDPLTVVMLTRERIQDTLEDAVRRGRVTRSDANDLAGELLRRGRQQTEELLSEMDRVLAATSRRSRISDGVGRLAKTAEKARRTVTSDGPPIDGYDECTARQVQSRLGELTPAQLRAVADYERRHANRKTVLDAVNRVLGD